MCIRDRRNCYNHSLYLIAEKAYRQADASTPPKWYTQWVDGIKESIKRGESTYLRDGKYDRLLSLLFPEMAAGLAHDFGKKQVQLEQDLNVKMQGIKAPKTTTTTTYLDTPP